MSYDGFYSISFGGAAGAGFGMLVLHNGQVVGADAAGVTYDGTYAPNAAGAVTANIVLSVPAGVQLVQGIAKPTPWQMPISATLPGDLGQEHPITVPTPAGAVKVVFKKLRNL